MSLDRRPTLCICSKVFELIQCFYCKVVQIRPNRKQGCCIIYKVLAAIRVTQTLTNRQGKVRAYRITEYVFKGRRHISSKGSYMQIIYEVLCRGGEKILLHLQLEVVKLRCCNRPLTSFSTSRTSEALERKAAYNIQSQLFKSRFSSLL